jgi:hypothetical protein
MLGGDRPAAMRSKSSLQLLEAPLSLQSLVVKIGLTR